MALATSQRKTAKKIRIPNKKTKKTGPMDLHYRRTNQRKLVMESPFLTAEELAAYLRLSHSYVQQSASSRPDMLPPRFNHSGRRLLWHKDDVDAWIEAGRIPKEPTRLIDLRGWAKGLVKKPVPALKNTSSPTSGKKLDALEPLPRKPALR